MAKKRVQEIPSEVQEVLQEVAKKAEREQREAFTNILKDVKQQHGLWDVPKDKDISFFDPSCSYELTKYKPIDKTRGKDFNPDWFTEVREDFLRTGHYTQYPRNTKAYADFWDREYARCQDGLTVNGYTITGDHYFFLNYYQLQDISNVAKAGTSRAWSFPKFFVAQYIFFHYLEMAKELGKNAVLMKARGVGFSEINASILANAYNCRAGSRNLIAAHASTQLDPTIDKVWKALNWLNDNTDGGFFKLRQACDTQYLKRASHYIVENGQKIETGWMSQIQGIVADKPSKLRGERVDLIIFEESGSWDGLTTAFIQSQALIGIQGHKFGVAILGGTGGDNGPGLAGLREMYYSPEAFDVLPYRHNNTLTKEYTQSGFFLPASSIVNLPGYMDKRGWTDPEKGTDFCMKDREKFAALPKKLLSYAAEYCLTAEEAFSQEGSNDFDQTRIAEQLSAIRLTKTAPPIQIGNLSYTYLANQERTLSNVTGYNWELRNDGKIHILEHPIWTQEYQKQQDSDSEQLVVKQEPVNNLYVAGIDSIDIGMEDTSEFTENPSKFCIIIFKRAYGTGDPIPVAYYMERPEHIRDAYKIAMCMVTYYQAVVNLEATRMNLYAWAREKGYYKYFMMRPKATYPDPNKIGKRTPGTPATPAIISHQLALIANYIEDYGHHIWFEALLDELNRYSIEQKTHFDMVAALGMAMLANEELEGVVATKVQVYKEEEAQILGYYYDERGYKRYGIIPNKRPAAMGSLDASFEHVRSSDPRAWGY